MIKKFLYHLLIITSLTQLHTHAVIIESNTLEDVYKHLEENTLVLFDIDNTIAEVAKGIEPWIDYKTAELVKQGLKKEEAFHFVLCMFFILSEYTKFLPIGNAPAIIENLQKRKVQVLALTKRSMPVSKTTIKQLKDIGIDFSKNTLYQKDLNLPVRYIGGFSHGIIFTGSNNKGEILALFLKKVNYTPKKIVFLDDGKSHLQSVQKMCKEKNIPFIGIRYSGMDEMKRSFNFTTAEKNIYDLKIKAGFEPIGSTFKR